MVLINCKTIKLYEDILFDFFNGIAKITINIKKVCNAFRPETICEMIYAMDFYRDSFDINIILITGSGSQYFCSGGYKDKNDIPRLNVLYLYKKIREIPKPVIAMVNGYAIGGVNVLQTVCDITIASENSIFGQNGPKVGSFD